MDSCSFDSTLYASFCARQAAVKWFGGYFLKSKADFDAVEQEEIQELGVVHPSFRFRVIEKPSKLPIIVDIQIFKQPLLIAYGWGDVDVTPLGIEFINF